MRMRGNGCERSKRVDAMGCKRSGHPSYRVADAKFPGGDDGFDVAKRESSQDMAARIFGSHRYRPRETIVPHAVA